MAGALLLLAIPVVAADVVEVVEELEAAGLKNLSKVQFCLHKLFVIVQARLGGFCSDGCVWGATQDTPQM